MSNHIWFDGEIRSQSNPFTGADTEPGLLEQGLHYGTGVFEGIRAYDTERGPAIFRMHEHMQRLQRGAELLQMPIDIGAMTEATHTLLALNGLSSAYIRPIAFYGGGKLHLDVHDLLLRQAVATLPWTSHLGGEAEDQGVSLQISQMRKNAHQAIPTHVKLCGAYVNSIIAKLQATRAGFDESLFLDADGRVVEASAENVFMVTGDRIVANEHPDALPGITRDTIAQITGAELRSIHRDELLEADEVFLVGTSAEVAPVTRIDDRRWAIGPRTREIQRAYQDVVHGRDASFEHWLSYVDTGRLAAK